MIKKIHNYQEFILEKQNSILPPLIEDFLENIKVLEPEISFEDWWCISDENVFLSYFEKSDMETISVANNEEREERNKSDNSKKVSPYFVIEFSNKNENRILYFIIGIDMKLKTFYLDKVYPVDYQKKFIDFSEKSLKKNYPIIHTSRRFGL